jgi:hypothetical protein
VQILLPLDVEILSKMREIPILGAILECPSVSHMVPELFTKLIQINFI